jgi:hypothetical protein
MVVEFFNGKHVSGFAGLFPMYNNVNVHLWKLLYPA